MELKDFILSDPEILGGQVVFKGTRVPIETLFDHLEAGVSLDVFLEDFPSVTREAASVVLQAAGRLMTAKNLLALYEAAA